jgi:hypothetical protein
MNNSQNPQLHKHSVVRRFYLSIRDEIKSIGVFKAKKNIESATEISKYRTSNLAMYGEPYRKTMEFARLELAEKFAVFKYEFYKALFRL